MSNSAARLDKREILKRPNEGSLTSKTLATAGRYGLAVTTAIAALAAAPEVRAINLNDSAVMDAGGIGNYWDSANTMNNVVSIFDRSKGNWCTGTLINSRTILTASHCLIDENTGQIYTTPAFGGMRIQFDPNARLSSVHDRGLSGALAHAAYNSDELGINDIALLSLDRPVAGIKPVTLIKAGDPLPGAGTLVVMSGYGASGTGSQPNANDDALRRIGRTHIGGYRPASTDAPDSIAAQFRDPLSPSSPDEFDLSQNGIAVPYLQAQPGPGDSGGPLFIATPNGLVQIGTVIGGGNGYGAVDFWTPVLDYLGWIDANNPLRWSSAQVGTFKWSQASAWRDTLGRSEIPHNVDGNFNGFGTLGRYYNVAFAAPSAVSLDMNPTVDNLVINHAAARLDIPTPRTLTTLVDTQIGAGTLNVDGRLSAFSVDVVGGTLSGTGVVSATQGVVNRGGLVAPGSTTSLGTLTIDGDYRQAANAALAVRIIGSESDKLAVTGRAQLGGTLAVGVPTNSYDPNRHYRVLTAGAGVSGRFDTVLTSTSLLFLETTLAYQSNAVDVSLTRNEKSFTSVATTENGSDVAQSLDSLPWQSPLYQAVVTETKTSGASLGASLDTLSGEAHASAVSAAYQSATLVQDAVMNRLRTPVGQATLQTVSAAFAADKPGAAAAVAIPYRPLDPRAFGLWGEGFGGWGRTGGDGAYAMKRSVGGFVIGADATFDERFRLGFAGGLSRSSFDVDALNSSGSNESIFGAIYGSANFGAVRTRLGASYAHNSIDTQRVISIPGFSDHARADYDGSTLQAFGEMGYRVAFNRLALEPFVGAAAIRVHTNSFAEVGGAAALTSFARSQDIATTTLGLRAEGRISEDLPLIARGMLGWRHAYGAVSPEALLAFSGSAPFLVEGAPIDRNALVAEATLDWQASDAITFSVGYQGQLGNRAQDHGLKGNFVWRF
ncbi:autotransporter outer membrane beta-barrel domain-containing protein [Microvirga alba]|uniref:autotransporter outer membrane beta-barrel domain-containing protein n=1 Tax=Microvirga alba TaxID=2791025 RepID=UPI001AEEFF3C|nr:autotransporter domain-containing protein [Microvirga alba]